MAERVREADRLERERRERSRRPMPEPRPYREPTRQPTVAERVRGRTAHAIRTGQDLAAG